jgi:DNA-directed RNA polymerase sigma subunit (sigma70/sigma32)
MPDLTERNVAIFMAREAGRTLRDIACEFGLTHERIRQICFKVARKARYAAKLNPPT